MASWPGLATVLATHIRDELKASEGKKKGLDAALYRTFRRLVQLADDEKRAGGALGAPECLGALRMPCQMPQMPQGLGAVPLSHHLIASSQPQPQPQPQRPARLRIESRTSTTARAEAEALKAPLGPSLLCACLQAGAGFWCAAPPGCSTT